MIDSHAHLDFVDDLEGALARAKEAGVNKIVSVGTNLEESKKVIQIAGKYSTDGLQIYTSVGIHPKDGKEDIEKLGLLQCFETVKQIVASSHKVVAIGECGLDIATTEDTEIKNENTEKEREFQRELFEGQIKLAVELNLPLVIHCRNGWDEIFEILNPFGDTQGKQDQDDSGGLRGVFHSWTGDWGAAQKALDLGFYISFSGIVTFKNALTVQEVAKKVPIERILIETDSPFLAPEPLRSGSPPKLTTRLSSTFRTRLVGRNRRVYRKNEPGNVRIVCKFISDIRKQSFELISSNTSENAKRLFGI